MSTAAIIVAAGRGNRAGGDQPKQWQIIAGRRVIDWTLRAFTSHLGIDHIVIVAQPGDEAHIPEGAKWVPGAATRSGSVKCGLRALPDDVSRVLIHDAARPCVSAAVISRVIEALDTHEAAAPGIEVTDALWREADGKVAGTQSRAGLVRAQTPQGFRLPAIRLAHERGKEDAPDDVTLIAQAGFEVAIVSGEAQNIKITQPEDFERAAKYLTKYPERQMDVRLGNGYDVHRFSKGTSVTLCGVEIAHDRGLDGHSDADVGMHALTDAIYGALAEGDIGRHFPPSDAKWRGADSAIFLDHAGKLAVNRGYQIGNADVTLVCEQPKIGPHAAAMATRLAEILGCAAGKISVKATTSEQLGFTGRGEGIAALATCTLISKD